VSKDLCDLSRIIDLFQ